MGADLVAISTGALADDAFRTKLVAAAAGAGSRVVVPAGAIGGLEGLGAVRLGGLIKVAYTSIKPPRAWLGTPAEAVADLSALREPTVVFRGSARDAALGSRNANLAITVALAAGALDETVVTLIADPEATENLGLVEAEGPLGKLALDIRGPAAGNPCTSAVTAFSLIQVVERRTAVLVI